MANQPNWINKGVPGNTTDQMLARFQTDVIDLHPDVVHILGGADDAKFETWPLGMPCGIDTCGNLEEMSAMAQAAGIKVVVGTPIDVAGMTQSEDINAEVFARQLRLSRGDSALWALIDYRRSGGGNYTSMTSMAQAEIGYAYGTPMPATAQHILAYDPTQR
jgi:hypothetical protein